MLRKIIDGWNEMSLYRKVRRVFMIGLAIFGLWALTPYLYNREVNEDFPAAMPAAQAPAMAAEPTAMSMPEATEAPAMMEEPTAMSMPAATEAPAMMEEPTAMSMPEAMAAEPTAMSMTDATEAPAMAAEPTAMSEPAAPQAPTAAPSNQALPIEASLPTSGPAPSPAPIGPQPLLAGNFIPGSTPGDRATGGATIYRLEDGRLVLRLQDLDVTNGPDLFVVLSGADNPDQQGTTSGEHLQLDGLKGNQGNQNYELPIDIDLAKYKTAVIWCRAFDIVFGYAVLQPPA
jgi:hypothetical protein